jgi:phospholipid/cholesterol/gamma-HCH transport system substrate-binding protein
LIEGAVDRVEIDQVLAALDPPTRERLKSLVQRLRQTLDGNEDELNATLRAAGPALEALGQVLEAVGNDGPAIRSLVERLYTMTATLTARQDDVSAVIGQLSRTSRATAAQQAQLRAALQELPPTLEVAQRTLDDVPPTVDKTVPLLADLRPATQRLTSVSRNLSPLLSDLRPAVADLKPTLVAAQSLLQVAPGLLDDAHATLPGINTAAGSAQPALSFLRPYTPELAGWLSNWGSASAGYDSIGHYMRAFVQQGGSSVNANPGVLPPGIGKNAHREPGENEGQPWTDATGSSLR